MEILTTVVPYAQIIVSVLLIAAILLQQTDQDLSAVFGGGGGDAMVKHTRRGFELFLFRTTIILAIIFALLGALSFFI